MTSEEEVNPEQVKAITDDLMETFGESLGPGVYVREPGANWKVLDDQEADAHFNAVINSAEDCEHQRELMAEEIARVRNQRDYEVYCGAMAIKIIRQLELRNERLSKKLVYRAQGIGETRKRLSEVLNPNPGGFLAKFWSRGR